MSFWEIAPDCASLQNSVLAIVAGKLASAPSTRQLFKLQMPLENAQVVKKIKPTDWHNEVQLSRTAF